jgi:hypothetical protein
MHAAAAAAAAAKKYVQYMYVQVLEIPPLRGKK